MRPDASRVLENLATSIADGAKVDWEHGGAQLSPDEQRLLKHLRLIDSLAEVYRTLPPAPEDTAGVGPPGEADPAGPRWGRLILLDRIGQGTSGDVFRAWDGELQREVALKLLRVDGVTDDAAANARMLQEARRLARIRHPHVVHVYGAERHEGRIGLWMELVRGRTLDEMVRTDGVAAPDKAAMMVADLCGAVAAVHAAGLLHRDIKAQNAIVEDNGRIVLMDFGTGEEIGSTTARVAGTPLYLAPEILAGAAASAASDVYSLGVLLFYLVTGTFPVQATSVDALKAAHRNRGRRLLRGVSPGVPAAFARVADRALSDEPSARYATAAAMEHALRDFVESTQPARARARRRGWAAAVGMAASVAALVATLVWSRNPMARPAAEVTTIAVLPLTFVSGQSEAPYLAEGLTDELITTLGQVNALHVISHTSVRRFRGTSESVGRIAAQLGVGSVLEGSIAVQPSPSDPRVRVNVRLIRAGSDVELWSDSFERPLGDLLALERDIARAVARSVRVTLSPQESARFARAVSVSGPAQRAYLEGISFLAQNRHGAEVRPALEVLQRAIALDPSFAAPHAAAARAYVLLGFDGEIPQRDAYAAAQAEASRALVLDPDLADAHSALADVSFYYEWDWRAAEAGYVRAITLDGSSSYARTQYARLLAALGRTDAARQQADEAAATDPLTADVTLTAGLTAYYQRRYDEAREILRRAIRMDPRFPGAYFTLGRVEEARGHIADAMDLTDRAIRLSNTPRPTWRAQALRLRALAGQDFVARKGLAQLQASLASENRVLDAPFEAYVRLALGERDAAIALLSAAVASRDPAVLWIAVDPRLDSIRPDPRFQAVVSRLGRP